MKNKERGSKLKSNDTINILRLTYENVKKYGTYKRYCVVSESNHKSGLVDEHGNIIIPCEYDSISQLTNHLLLCKQRDTKKSPFNYGRIKIFDLDGNLVIDGIKEEDMVYKPSKYKKIGEYGYLLDGIICGESNYVKIIRNNSETDTKSKVFISKDGTLIGLPNFYASEFSKTCPEILTVLCAKIIGDNKEKLYIKAIRLDQSYRGLVDMEDAYDKIEKLSLESAIKLGNERGYDTKVLQVMEDLGDMEYHLGFIGEKSYILNDICKPVHFHRINRINF